MPSTIHPSSIVAPGARIADGVTIGPFCTVGAEVELAEGVELVSHVVIAGRTRVGARTRIYPFASIGQPPQDLKFGGEESEVAIGTDNTIREHVTVHRGTAGGGMVTRIGNHCLLMAGAHIAHDCQIGNHVIIATHASLAGHVVIGDHAILGGLAGVHQFVRIGAHAMIGGITGVDQDVIPYGLVVGERGHLAGLNLVGLKRRQFERDEINALRRAFKQLFQAGRQEEMTARVDAVAAEHEASQLVAQMIDFIRGESDRKILQAKPQDAG